MTSPLVDEHFSPSSITLADGCERAWGYRYLEGRRELDLSWADIQSGAQCTSRQKSAAFGKAVHEVLEGYFTGQAVDWTSAPGRVALAGMPYLPRISELGRHEDGRPWAWVEEPIQIYTQDWRPNIEPVLFEGYIDLVAGLADRRLFLHDYKTTVDFRWAKSAQELCRNLQAVAYYTNVVEHWAVKPVCRWVYFQRPGWAAIDTGIAKAQVVEFQPSDQDVVEVMGAAIDRADGLRKKLRAFKKGQLRVLDLPANPDHCEAFGGCPHHVDRGGPCEAGTTPEATIARYSQMSDPNTPAAGQPLTPFQQQCLAAGWPAPGVTPADVTLPAAAPPPSAATLANQASVAPPPAATQPEPAKGRGRPKGSKNKPKADPPAAEPPAVIDTTGTEVVEPGPGPGPEPGPGPSEPPVISVVARLRIEAWVEGKYFKVETPAPEEIKGYVKALVFGLTGAEAE